MFRYKGKKSIQCKYFWHLCKVAQQLVVNYLRYDGDQFPLWTWFNEDSAYRERPLGPSFKVGPEGCPHFSVPTIKDDYRINSENPLRNQTLLHRVRCPSSPTWRAILESRTRPIPICFPESPTLSWSSYYNTIRRLLLWTELNTCCDLCFFTANTIFYYRDYYIISDNKKKKKTSSLMIPYKRTPR